MVSALYAVLGALLLVKFSFDVVRLRTQYHVGYGDGGFSELQVAIRVHGNAVEYVPIGLILLLFMEMNGAQTWMVHVCGILLIVGRLMHSWGFHHRRLPLAPLRHERHLVRLVADGAGQPLVYALGVGFLPPLAHNTPFSFFRV
ncbi:inner membrane protein [Klebsiella variicola]|nr:inner membrane protein [Klebsiella variicola]